MDQYSAAWWNQQAQGAGKLWKSDIERLTGQTFNTIPQNLADGTIIPWYLRVTHEAQGFSGSGLLLAFAGVAVPPGKPIAEDPAAWANWPDTAYFVSPVGNVAPGTTVAYQPELQAEYTPETTVSTRAAGIPDYTPGIPGQVGTGTTYGAGAVPPVAGDDLVQPESFLPVGDKAGVPQVNLQQAQAAAAAGGATPATATARETLKTIPTWALVGIGLAALLAMRKRT